MSCSPIGALAVSTAVNYLVIYMPTYVVKTLNLPPIVGFVATLAAAIAVTILTPIAGNISDRIGRTSAYDRGRSADAGLDLSGLPAA